MRVKLPLFREVGATGPQNASMTAQASKWRDAPIRAVTGGRPAVGGVTTTASPALQALSDAGNAAMPDALAVRLDRCDPTARLPEQLVTALWDALQASTHGQASAWELIPSDACSYPVPTPAATAQPAGKVVSARFVDIGLIASTAIADTARAADDGGTYFLHANHLTPCCDFDFIAAQKPHRSETGGFLQMLLAKKVGLVVDLTTTSEWESDACYAPTQGCSLSIKSANVTVACKGHKRLPALRSTIQSLLICRRDDGATHMLQRLHFGGWPDHGVITTRTLRALAEQVETLHASSNGSILVHCMAGVGRTGTLISFIAARKRVRGHLVVEAAACPPSVVAEILMDTIARGRRDRGVGFVQTREQFALVLSTLLQEFGGDTGNVRAASVAIAGPTMAAAQYLGLMSDVMTKIVRQTLRRLTARFAGIGQARDDSAGVLPASVPAAATAPVMAAATTVTTTPPPALARAADVVATAPMTPDTSRSAANGRRAIAEDRVLAACYELAIARLDQVHGADAIEVLLAESKEAARQQGGPEFILADVQQEILKEAVLKRFHCRDKGIIFQAHLVRNANDKSLPMLGRKSGTMPTSAEPVAGRGA
ncbi:MAG: dual specificity protein phosphatase family protein [Herminiimonas sp.]|nr:dual specificity protein phosphatase family protein [Herminiimonas sp.]